MNESMRQEHLRLMAVMGATADELRNTKLRWEHEDAQQPYQEFDPRYFKSVENTGSEDRIKRAENSVDLSNYLYFDAREYYQEEIKDSLGAIEILKSSGNWNDVTAILHTYWLAKAEHDLKTFEDAPPEIKRAIRTRFLNYLHVVKSPTKEQFAELLANDPGVDHHPSKSQSAIRQEEPAKYEANAGQRLKDVIL